MDDGVNAMHDYQAAIKLDPCYALAYYNAGNLYFKQRQFKQVTLSFLSSFSSVFSLNIFLVSKALVYFEKAFSWDPRDESAILNAAITQVKRISLVSPFLTYVRFL